MKRIIVWITVITLILTGVFAMNACNKKKDADGITYQLNATNLENGILTVTYGATQEEYLKGITITRTENGVSTEVPVEPSMVTAHIDTSKIGTQRLQVNYSGQTFHVAVVVKYKVEFVVNGSVYRTFYGINRDEISKTLEAELRKSLGIGATDPSFKAPQKLDELLPAPEMPGYNFTGWLENSEVAERLPTILNKNTTYTASYNAIIPELSAIDAVYGDLLAEIQLPYTVAGEWRFVNAEGTVGDATEEGTLFDVIFVEFATGNVLAEDKVTIFVEKKKVTFTDVVETFIYNGKVQLPTFKTDAPELNVDHIMFYENPTLNYTDAGVYEYSFVIVDDNYEGMIEGTYQIKPQDITFVVELEKNEIYVGEAIPVIEFEVIGVKGMSLEEVVQFISVTDINKIVSGAGEYTITATSTSSNINLTVVPATLIIHSGDLVVEAPVLNAIYNDKVGDITFPDNPYGWWEWVSPNDVVGNVGEQEHLAVFVPREQHKYDKKTYTVKIIVAPRELEVKIEETDDTDSVRDDKLITVYYTPGKEWTITNSFIDKLSGTAYVDSDLKVFYTYNGVNYDTLSFMNAGIYEGVKITLVNGSNYQQASAQFTLIIKKIDPEFAVDTNMTETWKPGLTLGQITLPTISNGFFVWGDWTVSDDSDAAETKLNALNYSFVATLIPNDEVNYNRVLVTFTVNVNKATPVIQIGSNYEFTYSGAVHNIPNATVDANLFVDTPVFTYTYQNGNTFEGVTEAGTYVIVVTLLEGESGNYNSVQVEVTVTVKKADPVKPTQLQNAIYGDLALEKIVLPTHAQGTWSLKDVTEETRVGAVGQQTFVALFTPATGNYNSIEVSITVQVAKKYITVPVISAANQTQVYTGSLLTSGLATAEGYTVTDNGGIDVGTYTVQIVLDTTSYEWSTFGKESTFELTYQIINADNEWDVDPTIKTEWTYGDVDGLDENELAEYKGIASALHGTVTVLYAPYGTDDFGIAFPTNAGKYTVKFVATAANYNDLVATIDFTVHKQTVNIPTYTNTYVYTGSDITADIPTSILYDITGNVAKGAGSYVAKLALTDGANYKWSNGNSDDLSFAYTITKASVELSITINGWTYGQAANAPVFSVVKNFSDAVTPIVEYSADGVAWSENVPTNAGTYTVRVKVVAAEDDSYIGAEATCAFTIEKASVSIDGANNSYDKIYDGNEFAVPNTTASNNATVNKVITKGGQVVETIIGAGEYVITYSVAESANYLPATRTVTVTVDKADVTISAPAIEGWKYNEAVKAPVATFNQAYAQSSNSQITFKYFTDSACTNEITSLVNANAGTYYVKAVFAGNENLNATESVATEIVIAKAIVTIPSASDKEYNGDNQTSGLTANDFYTVYEDNGGTDHGEYQVILQLRDPSNYEWDTSAEAIVQGAQVTIKYEILTAVNKWIEYPVIDSWTYGEAGNAGTASAEACEQLIIEYKLRGADNSAYSTTRPTLAGDYVARFTVKDSNYKDLAAEVQFTIYKKEISAPTEYTKEYVYTGSDITAAIPTSSLYTVSNNVAKTVGNYSATLTLTDNANYKWSDSDSNTTTVPYSITKASVTLEDLILNDWIYDQTENTPTVTVNKGFADTVTVSFKYSVDGVDWSETVPTNAGTYKVMAEVAGTTNYNGAQITVEFTIIKAAVTISGVNDSYEKNYDGNLFAVPNATASNGATVNKVITKNGEAVDAIVGAGEYVITYSVVESANYFAATKTVTVTVGKADVTISTPAIEGWTYGDAAKAPSASFNETFAQSSNGEITFKYFTDAECNNEILNPVDAGTYYVKAVFAGNENLNGAESAATSFVIAKRIIATPTIADKVYNGQIQLSGLVSDLYTVAEVDSKNFGDYTVTITLNNPENYAWDSADNTSTTTTATYSITKASVSLEDLAIAGWESGKYDATQNTPTVTVVKGFTDDVELSFEYYVNGVWGTTVPTLAGDYAVRAIVKGSDNYNGAISDGLNFKVVVAEVVLPSVDETFTYTGSAQKPTFAESIYYTIVGNVEHTAAGTYTVTVVPTGTYSFVWAGETEATEKTISYTIQKASVTLSGLTMESWEYGQTASIPTVTVTKSFSDAVTPRYEYFKEDGTALGATCPTAAGNYVVKAIVDGTDNYDGATVEKAFTITKAKATFVGNPTFTGGKNGKYYMNQIGYSYSGMSATHAGQTIAGSFAFNAPVFVAGTDTSYIELVFTPTDTANYNTVSVKYYVTFVTVAISDTTKTSYGSIETALAAAVSGNTVRVLPHDADLGPIYIKENVTIKSGVTLLLPYGSTASDSNTWKNDQPNFDLHGGLDGLSSLGLDKHGCEPYEGRLPSEKYDAEYNPNPDSKCIVKVVLAEGLTITNNGTLIIAGELSGGGQGASYAGHTAGKHATLYLESNAAIVSESGSKIYAAGFIREASGSTGSQVIINSGATLFQPFVIKDYIDGNQMAALEGDMGDPHWTAPFTRFLFMNVSPELTIHYGGTMKVWAALYTQTTGASNATTVSFIGSGGVILLDNENSKLVAKYDVNTEICDVQISGGATIGSIHLKLSLLVFDIDADTKNCLFPLTYHFRVTLSDGEYIAADTQGFKMMPGAVLIVEEDAKLTIDRIFIYETFIDEVERADGRRYPTTYADGTPLPAAKLIVNGEFVCNTLGGKIYSEKEGAKVTVKKAATFTSYEPKGIKAESTTSNYVTSWNEFTQNALLTNQNGTTLIPEIGAANTYENGNWVGPYTIHFDANQGDAVSSLTISTIDTVYPALPTPTRTHYVFLGWKDANGNIVSQGSALPINKDAASGITLTAQWTPYIYTLDFEFKYEGWDAGSEPANTLPSAITFDVETATVTLPTPTGTGVFVGWYKDAACTQLIIDISGAELLEVSGGGNATLYGLWASKQFTIKYEGDHFDDVPYDNDTVIYTPSQLPLASLPTVPDSYRTDVTKDRYFDGWYYNGQKVTDLSFVDSSVSGEYTLTAKWIDKVSITYTANNTSIYTNLITNGDVTFDYGTAYWYEIGTVIKLPNVTANDGVAIDAAYINYLQAWTLNGADFAKENANTDYTLSGSTVINIVWGTKTKVSVTATKDADGNSAIDAKYSFMASTTADDSGKYYTPSQVSNAGATYYVIPGHYIKFSVASSNGNTLPTSWTLVESTALAYEIHYRSKSCIAAGTLVTLADGTQKKVEDLTMEDILLVFNHETGEYEPAGIIFIENDGWDYYNVITLTFSDGTTTKLIYEHALFDLTLNKYVYITEDNYTDFIGHEFAMQGENGFERVTMTDATLAVEYTGCFSLVTVYHLNYFIDGLFSIPGGITGLFNMFEYGDDLVYDAEKMQADIEEYGLFTYEDFEEFLPYEFYLAFPASYLKVSIGKGLMTFDDIFAYIDQFLVKNGLM